MSRIITADRLQQIADAHAADPNAPGPILGQLIIDGNVPVEAVARMLRVSDVTIYRWMYGTARPRDQDKLDKLEKLLTILRKAKRAKELPLAGTVPQRIKLVEKLVIAYRPLRRQSEAA
jgi:IS30 family transposase